MRKLIVLAVFGVMLGASIAWAEPKGYVVAPNEMALAMMPELKSAPAPDWVKPGTRFVFHQADASIPGSEMVLVQDPEGRWVVKSSGQTFRQDENPGAGGHGLLVVDIVSVQPDAVVAEVRQYLINGVPNGPLTVSTITGLVTTPSVLGDVYVQPTVLKKYANINDQNITSTPTKYKAAGKTYDAIWRQIMSAKGSRTYVFDPETGQILHTASCSTDAPQPVVLNGVAQNSGGYTVLAQSTLLGMRQVKVPWKQGKLPGALKDVHRIEYVGEQRTWLPNGSPLPPAPIQTVMKVTGRGEDFLEMERTGTMTIGNARMDLGKVNVVTGPAQMMPFAVDPEDLAALRQGQELDRDPTTEATVSVTFMGRDSGKDVVTLSEKYPGKDNLRIDAVYERATGMCIASSSNNVVLHQLTRVVLKGMQ